MTVYCHGLPQAHKNFYGGYYFVHASRRVKLFARVRRVKLFALFRRVKLFAMVGRVNSLSTAHREQLRDKSYSFVPRLYPRTQTKCNKTRGKAWDPSTRT